MAAKKTRKKSHKKTGKRHAKKSRKKTGKKKASRKGLGGHTKKANYTAHHHSAHRKAGTSYGSKAAEFIRAQDLLASAKRGKRGKRWSCKGPVRSGCGGSGSKVVKGS